MTIKIFQFNILKTYILIIYSILIIMMLIPAPHSTIVTVITPGPPTRGSNFQLVCNVTKIGYPENIIQYTWYRDYMELKEGNKYSGVETRLFTVQVYLIFMVECH